MSCSNGIGGSNTPIRITRIAFAVEPTEADVINRALQQIDGAANVRREQLFDSARYRRAECLSSEKLNNVLIHLNAQSERNVPSQGRSCFYHNTPSGSTDEEPSRSFRIHGSGS